MPRRYADTVIVALRRVPGFMPVGTLLIPAAIASPQRRLDFRRPPRHSRGACRRRSAMRCSSIGQSGAMQPAACRTASGVRPAARLPSPSYSSHGRCGTARDALT
ncbi:hypothetical protein C8R44DRAFT_893177 [Mycena epipterygia]|nr:hypothetical protein C8R44DRAFT_893177 [Mycena epipterygia]